MKKIFKILGISLLVIILILVASPFLFKGKLENLLKNTINSNLNAQVSWESLDISLLRNFPDATVTLSDFNVVNNAPFVGDTLAQGEALRIEMGIKQLFKKADSDPIKINALYLDNAAVAIQIDTLGNTNYDIVKKAEGEDTTNAFAKEEKATTPFSFDIAHYEINNTSLLYQDASSKTDFRLTELNHEGNGDFSVATSTLNTTTDAIVVLNLDDINYLNGQKINLEAAIGLDLENQTYTFKENKALINELPLTFEGFVQLVEDGTAMDISFETSESDFKNFLALIPSTYAKSIDGVETSGDFRVSGFLKGKSTETTIPMMDIAVVSNNASFKYPDLPKRMDNINIDAKIKNDTGLSDDTYVTINQLQFKIDDDAFSANGKLRNLATNMLVNLAIKGTLDLGNIGKVYPLDLDQPLQGRIATDLTTNFDMQSVEQHQYQNIKSIGTASLNDFTYTTEELPKPLSIKTAQVSFAPEGIQLTDFEGKTGDSDMKATGTIQNLIPFVMSKEDLKGRFDVTSEVFNLNDFSVTEENASTTQKSSENTPVSENGIKIPDFLDAALNFDAQKVIYDDLELTAVSGTVAIQNEEAQLNNVQSTLLGGQAGISGKVTTQNGAPEFDVNLDLSKIDISESFKNLDLLKGLAPIAQALQGALNTNIKLQGSLDENLAPIMSTVQGNAFAEVLTANVDPSKTPLLAALDNQLDFIDLSKIDLNKLKTQLRFQDGNVVLSPFDIAVDDINVTVSGGHSFDNVMNYALKLDVPAGYFGDDVGGLLAKLTNEEKDNLSVDLPIALSGNFTKPIVKLDTKAAITDLTNQIIQIQKQRLIDKGGNALTDILGDVLGGNKPQDSTNTNSSGQTPKVEDAIKDAAGGLLDNLFGKKKKKKTKKDSIGN